MKRQERSATFPNAIHFLWKIMRGCWYCRLYIFISKNDKTCVITMLLYLLKQYTRCEKRNKQISFLNKQHAVFVSTRGFLSPLLCRAERGSLKYIWKFARVRKARQYACLRFFLILFWYWKKAPHCAALCCREKKIPAPKSRAESVFSANHASDLSLVYHTLEALALTNSTHRIQVVSIYLQLYICSYELHERLLVAVTQNLHSHSYRRSVGWAIYYAPLMLSLLLIISSAAQNGR